MHHRPCTSLGAGLEAHLLQMQEENRTLRERLSSHTALAEEERASRREAEARMRESCRSLQTSICDLESELEATRMELESERRCHANARVEDSKAVAQDHEHAETLGDADVGRKALETQLQVLLARLDDVAHELSGERQEASERQKAKEAEEQSIVDVIASCNEQLQNGIDALSLIHI